MGYVSGDQYGVCTSEGTNYSKQYQVYYENYGVTTCSDTVYPGIRIPEQSSIYAEEFYDGSDGRDGYPQFQGWVQPDITPIYVNEGDLYYASVHGAAATELQSGTTTTCPVLTDGSPWQNWGTDANGAWDNGTYELYLEVGEVVEPWNDYDPTPSLGKPPVPFYYDGLQYSPDQWRANGPSTGAA
jgi:hypothetical protein